ncbi:hypothetical protein FHS09_001801 [Microbulbifer rhizosphaerae]|uniref:Uncharacterized protein n=1 Tax=Microbulbifer rhizosphaerae TaxID=1562603 RepID=A0A7W4Z8W6_9GAMM|nr:hypothetical protein [Microbulbifer rhizosphaerae]
MPARTKKSIPLWQQTGKRRQKVINTLIKDVQHSPFEARRPETPRAPVDRSLRAQGARIQSRLRPPAIL